MLTKCPLGTGANRVHPRREGIEANDLAAKPSQRAPEPARNELSCLRIQGPKSIEFSGCIYCLYEAMTAVLELNVRCIERNGVALYSRSL